MEEATEGEDVAARIGRFPAKLLRRGVADRPQDDVGVRRQFLRNRLVLLLRSGARLRLDQLGEAEIEYFHDPVGRDEHVGGLQIPMDDSPRMRGGEAVGDPDPVLHRVVRRNHPLRQAFAQGLPFQQLVDDERGTFAHADVEERDDVGMVERRHRPRLQLEPREAVGVTREIRRQDLDRHLAREPRVERPIDLAHPALAEGRNDLVRAQSGPGCQGHDKEELVHGAPDVARCA